MNWKLILRIGLYIVAIFCLFCAFYITVFLMGYADDALDHTQGILILAFIFILINLTIDSLILVRNYNKPEFIWASSITVIIWIAMLYFSW